jgi:hypothetical protein
MAAGPFRIVSLLSREAADQLGLAPGVLAIASIKATNVTIEIPTASGGPDRHRRTHPAADDQTGS